MLITAAQLSEIAKTVVTQDYEFDNIGLRIQESDYGLTIGQEIDHCSRHWDDGEMTDEEIDGICAVDAELAVKYKLSFGGYIGNVILVLGSNCAKSGEDDGEIILESSYGSNPVILDIIRL
jgi:hypothetical protein